MQQPRHTRPGLAILLVIAASAAVLGQSPGVPQVLFDLVSTPVAASSDPVFGAVLPDGRCVFSARTRTNGLEPWIMGPAGPSLLKDIVPGTAGSAPRDFCRSGSFVFFTANDLQSGSELWRTDGTVAGTVMVVDLSPGAPGALPQDLTDAGGTLFFTAFDPTTGRELYKSDGTAAGTLAVADVAAGTAEPEIAHIVPCGTSVFFIADDGVHGDELWISDGTAAGTTRLTDFLPLDTDGVNRFERPVCGNGKLYFVGQLPGIGTEPCVSDGTIAGTMLLANVSPGSSSSGPRELTFCEGLLYFSGQTFATGRELFKSDGTAAGTGIVRDIEPGSSGSFPTSLACCDGVLYFAASESSTGTELYRTDGTPAGTVVVKDIVPGSSSSFPSRLTCCDDLLFFRVQTPAAGAELWVSDGTDAGTQLVSDSVPGAAGGAPDRLFCCNGTLLYANTAANGTELFSSDGVPGGAVDHDLDPSVLQRGSDPRDFVRAGPHEFFFTATSAQFGRELHQFDGNQVIVHDLEPGPAGSDPQELVFAGALLVFSATTTTTGRELFSARRDQPPSLVANHFPGPGNSNPKRIVKIDDAPTFAFAIGGPATGEEPAVFGAGTSGIQVFDVNPSGSSFPNDFTAFRDPASGELVVAFSAFSSATGREAYAMNGMGAGNLIEDLNPGPAGSNPEFSVDAVDLSSLTVKFSVGPVDMVGKVDVIDASLLAMNVTTHFQSNVPLGSVQAVGDPADGKFVGVANDLGPTGTGSEFFTFDPVAGFQVNDMIPGPLGSNPSDFVATRDGVFARVDTPATGAEMAFMDSSFNLSIFDILTGPDFSNPSLTVTIADSIVVVAAGTSDPQDRDVYRISSDGGMTKIVDNEPFATNDVYPGREAMRSSGDLVVNGFLNGTGPEPVFVPKVGGMSDVFGKASPESIIAATDAVLGEPMEITVQFFGINVTATVLAVGSLLADPIGFNGDEVWIDPPTALVVAQNAGLPLSITVNVPNVPALAGFDFALQAAAFAPIGGPPGGFKVTRLLQVSL